MRRCRSCSYPPSASIGCAETGCRRPGTHDWGACALCCEHDRALQARHAAQVRAEAVEIARVRLHEPVPLHLQLEAAALTQRLRRPPA